MPASTLDTIREWLRYSAWANARLIQLAADMGDAQLDRPFDMGMGSFRRTMMHILDGEIVWLERWQERSETPWPDQDRAAPLARMRDDLEAVAARRQEWMSGIRPEQADRRVVYRDSKGGLFQASLRDMLLQGCVHSSHHRAQALNMLKHLGAALPKPGIDYIFMKIEEGSERVGAFDKATLGVLFSYGDWANGVVLEAASRLSDAQLDQPFDMGIGSVRKTLLHIRFAEQWWLTNWIEGPGRPFPELPPTATVGDLRTLWRETISARNAELAKRSDEDLRRIVEAVPRPGVVRTFPQGTTMLQLCSHGIHHRAQVVNMIRRAGGAALEMDYMMHARTPAS